MLFHMTRKSFRCAVDVIFSWSCQKLKNKVDKPKKKKRQTFNDAINIGE
jgi:hypothetical protein